MDNGSETSLTAGIVLPQAYLRLNLSYKFLTTFATPVLPGLHLVLIDE